MEDSDSKTTPMVQSASPEATWKSLEKAPALLAAMSSCLYVVGFLVVTGFLGSKGVHDHPFLSGRYVMAGGLTAACAVMYYFFVWRKTARRARERLNVRPGLSAAFRAYVTHYFVIEDLFNCACYSVWLIGIFGTTANAHLLALVAAIIYVVDQQIFAWGLPRHPRISFALSGVLLSLSIAALSVVSTFLAPLFSIFVLTSGFTLLSIVVLTSEDWSQRRDRLYGTWYLTFSAVILAIGFGTNVYGHLSLRFGGGEPPRISVIFSKDASADVRAPIEAASKNVYLLSDDKETLTLELGEIGKGQNVLRLDRGLVQAMRFEKVIQVDALTEWISERFVRAPTQATAASTPASATSAAVAGGPTRPPASSASSR